MRAATTLILVSMAIPLAAAAPQADALDWHLPLCKMTLAFVDVDTARLREILPPGFAPITWGPLDYGQVGASGKVLVEFAHCGSLSYGNWEVLASPPSNLRKDGLDEYYVNFDTLIQDPLARTTSPRGACPCTTALPN